MINYIDELARELSTDVMQVTPIGPYGIFFDGFFANQYNTNLISRVLAWPVRGREDQKYPANPHMVGIVRGRGWGMYEPGGHEFDLRPDNRGHFKRELFGTPEGRDAIRADVSDALQMMTNMVNDHLAGRYVPVHPKIVLIPVHRYTGEIIEEHNEQSEKIGAPCERTYFRELPGGKLRKVTQRMMWVDVLDPSDPDTKHLPHGK